MQPNQTISFKWYLYPFHNMPGYEVGSITIPIAKAIERTWDGLVAAVEVIESQQDACWQLQHGSREQQACDEVSDEIEEAMFQWAEQNASARNLNRFRCIYWVTFTNDAKEYCFDSASLLTSFDRVRHVRAERID